MKDFLAKTHYVIPLALALAALAGGALYFFNVRKSAVEFIPVARMSLSEEVSGSGAVQPTETVDLAFERSGKVSSVNAAVGQAVEKGQVLVTLDGSDLLAEKAQAEAAVAAAAANLAQKKTGARPEEIAIDQAAIDSAAAALSQAEANAVETAENSYSASDSAIHGTVDQFFSNPRSITPQLLFSTSNPQNELDVEAGRVLIEQMFSKWEASNAALQTGSDLSAALEGSGDDLSAVATFLDKVLLALETAASSNLPASSITLYQSEVAQARASVQSAASSVIAAEAALKTAAGGLAEAKGKLALDKAPGTADEIAAAASAVEQADANVQNLQALLAKTVMRAPFSGTVTRADAKVGEIAVPGAPLVSLISNERFEVELYVPEVDVGRLAIGDSADVTLDAYGGARHFSAAVVAIDPAETMRNGVPAYKTTLQFSQDDPLIKSGMTANVRITTGSASNVLAVPAQAIITRGDKKFVLVEEASTTRAALREVTLGVRGSNGFVEVTEGLSEGERIVGFDSGGASPITTP